MTREALKKIFIILVFAFSSQVFGQSKAEEKLAVKYFTNGEYSKCVEIFEDLYQSGKKSTLYFNYLLDSYIGLEYFGKAEKLAKKFIKKRKDNPIFYVDLAKVYEKMGEEEKAQSIYLKAIEKSKTNNSFTSQLGAKFELKEKFELALKLYTSYEKAKPSSSSRYRIARLYGKMGELAKMYDILIIELESNPGALASVKGQLRNIITVDSRSENNRLLKGLLIKKMQRNAPPQLLDLLIWQFVQEKNFEEALIQEIAFDKRNRNDGARVMNLISITMNNKDWVSSRKGLNYVVSLGNEGNFYFQAMKKLLRVQYQIVQLSTSNNMNELKKLDTSYIQFFEEYGKNPHTQLILKDHGLFVSHYLKDSHRAEKILLNAVQIPGPRKQVANCKLAYADILLFNNEIWDALLYYNQVDKDFKHDILGSEARYRKAKVAFFQNDFEWSKAQLDVLKSSTEKLIANNAMELSLLIQENLNMDTNTLALELYAHAELLTYQNRFDEAIKLMDDIVIGFPDHLLIDDCLYLKSQIAYKRGDYNEQVKFLKKIIELYPYDLKADNSLYDLGSTYRDHLHDLLKAKEAFKKLFLEYSSSYFATNARKNFRSLEKESPDSIEINK